LGNVKCGGHWCPKCNESKGEKELTRIIENLGYTGSPQKTYPTCKDKSLLKFDNAIIDELPIDLLIEFDGKQHFETVDHFGGGRARCYTIKRDILKNKWVLENNKLLLRISHVDIDHIETLIKYALMRAKKGETGIIYSNPKLYKTSYFPSMQFNYQS